MLTTTEQIEISDFLVNIKPLLKQRSKQIRILKEDELDSQGFYTKLDKVFKELEIYDYINFIKSKPNDFDLYEEIVNTFCGGYFAKLGALDISSLKMSLMNYGNNFDHLINRIKTQNLTSFDGAVLNVSSYGNIDNNPIIIVLPTGLPMLIMKSWIEILANKYFVITWETRGMSKSSITKKLNIQAQLEDLKHIIKFFNLDQVHLFGVCHGANLVLHACNEIKSKIISASLWHGDYNWNDDNKLTYIQQNMKRLLEMSDGYIDTSDLKSLMTNPKSISKLSTDYPIQMLPHIMYPYITNQVFSNFIALSRDVLYRDLKQIVDKVSQNVLIVTSSKDNTAHPAGSNLLHSCLKKSEFHDRQEGSHISFFEAPKELYSLFSNFYKSNFASIRMTR
ncbi:hypothetical protein GCM10022393_15570 [Aquimarina addita]|uniref:AB hydrolase-1 domain-containing protein n=1 Tax=Aquimarina addita TaxID=870485 RepID=A0ABP7XGK4_9FLAO